MKLQGLTQNRKAVILQRNLELHKRFMLLISNNNVPRLKELVSVALRNKRKVSYIIDNVVKAIKGLYNACSSDDDKDIALLIYQFGGPSWVLLPACSWEGYFFLQI